MAEHRDRGQRRHLRRQPSIRERVDKDGFALLVFVLAVALSGRTGHLLARADFHDLSDVRRILATGLIATALLALTWLLLMLRWSGAWVTGTSLTVRTRKGSRSIDLATARVYGETGPDGLVSGAVRLVAVDPATGATVVARLGSTSWISCSPAGMLALAEAIESRGPSRMDSESAWTAARLRSYFMDPQLRPGDLWSKLEAAPVRPDGAAAVRISRVGRRAALRRRARRRRAGWRRRPG